MNNPTTNLDLTRPQDWREHLGVYRPGADALYPADWIDIARDTLRFHVQVWDIGRADRDRIASQDILYIPGFSAIREGLNAPLFRTRTAHAQFSRWWRRYEKLFDGKPGESYLPVLRSGRVKGVVVEDDLILGDGVLASMATGRSLHDMAIVDLDHYMWLPKLAPHWAWIAANCTGRVYRVHTGWLFARDNDAVRFRLTIEDR